MLQKKTNKALKKWFEPASRKHRYEPEPQARRRKKRNWMDYAEDFKVIADKVYSDLQAEAQEQLALNYFLSQLDNPQVAFAVKQRDTS